MQKHQIFHHKFKKEGDKLVISGSDTNYRMFIAGLEEGQTLEIFMEANEDTATLAQLAKVHVCLRELAKETGTSFEDMKFLMKKKAGLCFMTKHNNENVLYCKSLSDASKEELGALLEGIIEAGDMVGCNFR